MTDVDTFDVPIVLAFVFSALTLAYGRYCRWSVPYLALGAFLGFLMGPIPIIVSLVRKRLRSSPADHA